MVDKSVLDSLGKDEVKRQGLWWELVSGEREFVRDLKVVCEVCQIAGTLAVKQWT
jgi:hypothetical protein